MRILQIHTRYRQWGGEDSVVDAESELLREGGHRVTQWHVTNPDDPVPAAVALALSIHNPIQARRVARFVDPKEHDIAHVHNTWFAMSPAVIRVIARLDIPVVMTLHNYRLDCANGLLIRDGHPCELCVGHHPFHAVRYGCYRDSRALSTVAASAIAVNRATGSWDRVDRFLALSEFAKSRAVAGGLDESRMTVVPNFVPDPGPRPDRPSRSNVVVAVGRLDATKGFETLIDAWEMARPDGLRLRIIGDGPLRTMLGQRAGDDVEVVGRLDRAGVQREMLSARALLFPTHIYENMPMTVVEAWGAGLPVLGSRLGTTAEMLAPFGSEWLATPGDPKALAEAMTVLTDDLAVDNVGTRSRVAYERSHTPVVALASREAIYREVMASR